MALFRKPPTLIPKKPAPWYENGEPQTTSGVFKALKSTRHKMKIGTVLAGILTAFAIAGSTFGAVTAVQAQVDAGTARINERVTTVRDDLIEHKKEEAARHDRQEAKTDRLELKMDILLDYMRVPMSQRPERAPKDGGQ